jgi:hypothetical protein
VLTRRVSNPTTTLFQYCALYKILWFPCFWKNLQYLQHTSGGQPTPQATFSNQHRPEKIPTYAWFSIRSPHHPTHGIHPAVLFRRSTVYGVFWQQGTLRVIGKGNKLLMVFCVLPASLRGTKQRDLFILGGVLWALQPKPISSEGE